MMIVPGSRRAAAAAASFSHISAAVLELDRRGSRLLEQPHGLGHLVGPAEAGVGIDHERERRGPGEHARLLDELVTGEQADVGHAEGSGREGGTREIHGVEALLLDELGGQRERHTDDAERFRRGGAP
jgi:hypothetical protein